MVEMLKTSFEIFDINPVNNIKLNIEQTDKEHLFHYTSTNALLSILKNKQLWVTRSDFLNDSQEIKYMSNVLEQVIKELESKHSEYSNRMDGKGSFLSILIEQLGKVANGISNDIEDVAQIYILSLSENKDSLTLFSNYSNFEGYNIGFKTDELINLFESRNTKKNNSIQLLCRGKVNYNVENQVEIILNEILDVYNTLFQKLVSKGYRTIDEIIFKDIMQQTIYRILVSIKMYALIFKHPAFCHEEEYRMVFFVDSVHQQKNVKYRANNSIIIPYVELQLGNNVPVSSITIGPKNNIDVAMKSIECFLEHLNYKQPINVDKSIIPLRY
jgi:hypothetical protein